MFLYGILLRLSTPASDRIVFGSTDLTESNDGGTLVVFRLCAAIAALPSLPPFFQSLCWFWRDSSCKTALPLRGVEVCLSSSAYDVWSVDVSCVSPLNRKLRFRHSLETLNPRLRSDYRNFLAWHRRRKQGAHIPPHVLNNGWLPAALDGASELASTSS